MGLMKKGLTKQEIDDLRTQIPTRDVIAEKQGKQSTHGRIEDIENALVPWLRQRRKNRPVS